jgi:arsenate reductase (thioredoxin)
MTAISSTSSPRSVAADSGTHKPRVLFVCVHNAGRSQMAAAYARAIAGARVDVLSAGSDPASAIHPIVLMAMRERGIDLARELPKLLRDDDVEASDVVITMGCGDACPVYPGKRYVDWELADPAEKSIDEVRAIRDEIESRVRELLCELDVVAR